MGNYFSTAMRRPTFLPSTFHLCFDLGLDRVPLLVSQRRQQGHQGVAKGPVHPGLLSRMRGSDSQFDDYLTHPMADGTAKKQPSWFPSRTHTHLKARRLDHSMSLRPADVELLG